MSFERLERRLALDARLVADTNTISDMGSNPGDFEVFTDKLLFSADNSIEGMELWTSDGTEAGTALLKVIDVGDNPETDPNSATTGTFQGLTALPDCSVFVHVIENYYYSLWATDGTAAGTWLLKDFGTVRISVLGIAGVRAIIYTSDNGNLWSTDGTIAGTQLIMRDVYGTNLVALNDREAAISGLSKLIVTDGTPEGTHSISTQIAKPKNLTRVGDLVYYAVGANPFDLWKSDGTTEGTQEVKFLGREPKTGGAIGNRLLFSLKGATSGLELWISDGTADGTALLKDINSGLGDSSPGKFISVGNLTYFTANDGEHGNELWVTDGTEEGTHLVVDLAVGAASSSIAELTLFSGQLYFSAHDGVHGTEFWTSDGTAAGTVLVRDIADGDRSSTPRQFTQFRSQLVFSADDGEHGTEVWMTDGTSAGTLLFTDICTQNRSGVSDSISYAGFVFIPSADLNSEAVLWKSDGTTAGTQAVKRFGAGSSLQGAADMRVFRGELYFVVKTPEYGRELWKTDGSSQGTVLVKDILPGPGDGNPGQFNVVDNKLFFRATNSDWGAELWASDGTSAGTMIVKDLTPGPQGSVINSVSFVPGRLFVSAGAIGQQASQLWTTDTSDLTTLLFDPPVGFPSYPKLLAAEDGWAYVTERDRGATIWRTDGTNMGTSLLVQLRPSYSSGPLDILGRFDDGRYLLGSTESYDTYQLWIADFSSGESQLIREFTDVFVVPTNAVKLHNTFFFALDDHVHGGELWTSDGTTGGTELVKDIDPGPANAMVNGEMIYGLNGALYFLAHQAATGFELWTSDGTAAGTVLVQDIFPGEGSSLPHGFNSLQHALYIAAKDPVHGFELWRLNTGPRPLLDNTGDTHLAPLPLGALDNRGTLLKGILATGAHGDPITVDSGLTTPDGVAVVHAEEANGQWEFSVDGGINWSGLMGPSELPVRLLTANDGTWLRFIPSANYVGSASIEFRAWDGSYGHNGGSIDQAASNEDLSFSAATETATIFVGNAGWQNVRQPLDVNDDGFINGLDVLLVVNFLNSVGAGALPSITTVPYAFLDTNADHIASAVDVLLVVNFINSKPIANALPRNTTNLSMDPSSLLFIKSAISAETLAGVSNAEPNSDDLAFSISCNHFAMRPSMRRRAGRNAS